jgi:hypothetical protein
MEALMTRHRIRTFACTSRGPVRRFPVSRLDRLLARRGQAREFAGKEVRFATVLVVDESDQVGVSVMNAVRLRFDRAGRLSRRKKRGEKSRFEWRLTREQANVLFHLALESTEP